MIKTYLWLIAICVFCLFACKNGNDAKKGVTEVSIPKPQLILKADSVEGLFLTATDSKLVYIKPDNWDGDEGTSGRMILRDLKSKSEKIIDTTGLDDAHASELDDSTFVIAADFKVYKYNIHSSSRQVIYQQADSAFFVDAKLSSDKKYLAFITGKIDKNWVSKFYLFDMISKSIVYNKIWSEPTPEYCEQTSGVIQWINNDVIFNVNDNLYSFNVKNKTNITIAEKMNFRFAANDTSVVYGLITGKEYKTSLMSYRFKSKDSRLVTYDMNEDSLRTKTYFLNADNRRNIYLALGKSNYQFQNQVWTKVNNAVYLAIVMLLRTM